MNRAVVDRAVVNRAVVDRESRPCGYMILPVFFLTPVCLPIACPPALASVSQSVASQSVSQSFGRLVGLFVLVFAVILFRIFVCRVIELSITSHVTLARSLCSTVYATHRFQDSDEWRFRTDSE